MTRPPDGYPLGSRLEDPRDVLLRRRSAFARRRLGAGAWVHTPEVVDRVREAFDPLVELTSWAVDYVAIGGYAEVD
ncbi:MAG: hypothetical protein ACRDP8_10165 [Actinopolymorphaceae bacterium]